MAILVRAAGPFLACLLLLSNATLRAQNGWLPPSREVERPFAYRLHHYKTDMHTSVRPWRMKEVLAATASDTLRPSMAVLDRLGGWENGRRFRFGPLADAAIGVDRRGDATNMFHRLGGGAWLDADIGSSLNIHLDGQLWHQRFPVYLQEWVQATGVTPGEGAARGGPEYQHHDWNGHVSWDANRYINLTAGRGRNSFGEGHRSLMLSTEAQGHPYLRISTTVWKVKYVNLFAAMNDVRASGGDPANFRRKYAAMHYLSWNAIPRLNLSIFEAIIFDPGNDAYPRGFDVNYLNPVIFYRPVEFNIGSPDNALLGASINVKVGKGTLLYSQLVLDEFLWFHVRGGTGWYGNKQSVQLGAVSRNVMGVEGLTLRGEWNYVRPFMYTHINVIQNYAHFGQPLAHPYGSNVHELIAHGDLEQGRMMYSARLSMAWMGTDSVDSRGNNIFRSDNERPRFPGTNFQRQLGYYHGQYWMQGVAHAEFRAGWLLDRQTATRLEGSIMIRHLAHRGTSTTDMLARVGIICHFRDLHREQVVRYHLQ
jgi:hypothetical protein